MVRSSLCAVLATLSAVVTVGTASGASAPLPAGGGLAPLEALASSIASHIANRPVSVRCESGDWDANESGFVATQWNGSSGELLSLSPVAELSSAICAPLQQFASAVVKPTTCLRRAVPCYVGAGRVAGPQSQAYWSR